MIARTSLLTATLGYRAWFSTCRWVFCHCRHPWAKAHHV